MTEANLATSFLTLRSIDDKTRQVEFVASSDAVDSYDEIVEQSWHLERFKANPVILFAHDSRSLPIGHATRIDVVKGRLECTIEFATAEANPLAEQVWNSVKQKTLRAVSVGFVPGEIRREKRGDKDIYVLAQNTLHEVSLVPIPANPEALAKMRARAREHSKEKQMPMDHEKEALALRGQVESKDAELATLRKELAQATERAGVVERTLASTVAERDAAVASQKATDARVVDLEVNALIGTKIDPSEKDFLVELAATARGMFDKRLASLKGAPDKPILKRAMGDEATPPPATTGATGHGEGLAALIDAAPVSTLLPAFAGTRRAPRGRISQTFHTRMARIA